MTEAIPDKAKCENNNFFVKYHFSLSYMFFSLRMHCYIYVCVFDLWMQRMHFRFCIGCEVVSFGLFSCVGSRSRLRANCFNREHAKAVTLMQQVRFHAESVECHSGARA